MREMADVIMEVIVAPAQVLVEAVVVKMGMATAEVAVVTNAWT